VQVELLQGDIEGFKAEQRRIREEHRDVVAKLQEDRDKWKKHFQDQAALNRERLAEISELESRAGVTETAHLRITELRLERDRLQKDNDELRKEAMWPSHCLVHYNAACAEILKLKEEKEALNRALAEAWDELVTPKEPPTYAERREALNRLRARYYTGRR
jgi:hypothetical protein